jgi:hypothetical protein
MIGYFEIEEPVVKTTEEYWKDLLAIDILPITSFESSHFDTFFGLINRNIVDNLKVI